MRERKSVCVSVCVCVCVCVCVRACLESPRQLWWGVWRPCCDICTTSAPPASCLQHNPWAQGEPRTQHHHCRHFHLLHGALPRLGCLSSSYHQVGFALGVCVVVLGIEPTVHRLVKKRARNDRKNQSKELQRAEKGRVKSQTFLLPFE